MLRSLLIVTSLLLQSLILGCSPKAEFSSNYGWWESEDGNLHINISEDSLYIFDPHDENYLYGIAPFYGRYQVLGDTLITIRGYGDTLQYDTIGTFTNNMRVLEIHFTSWLQDSTVTLYRPQINSDKQLLKFQYSVVGDYVGLGRPNFDIEVTSSGRIIFNGIRKTRLTGLHAGSDIALFKKAELLLGNRKLIHQMTHLKKYRNDHVESHLTLFFEDCTTSVYTSGWLGSPLEFSPLEKSLRNYMHDSTLTPLDTTMYFDSHLARFYNMQDSLHYLAKYDSNLYKPALYPGGDETFWQDFFKELNSETYQQLIAMGYDHNINSPFWLNLRIDESGNVVKLTLEATRPGLTIPDEINFQLLKLVEKLPHWNPAMYDGLQQKIDLHMITWNIIHAYNNGLHLTHTQGGGKRK